MAIADQYSKEIRDNLLRFPVWEPGSEIAPGYVGKLEKGVFHYETTLGKLGIPISSETSDVPGERIFQSANSVTAAISGSGSSAGMKIDFSKAGAVIFYACEIQEARLDNLQGIRVQVEKLNTDHRWAGGHVFVSSVSIAKRIGVLISGGSKASVTLHGDALMLQQFKIAEAGITIGESSNIGYRAQTSGPALLDLYGFGWRDKKTVHLFAPRGPNAPPELVDISTKDPAHDEMR